MSLSVDVLLLVDICMSNGIYTLKNIGMNLLCEFNNDVYIILIVLILTPTKSRHRYFLECIFKCVLLNLNLIDF